MRRPDGRRKKGVEVEVEGRRMYKRGWVIN